MLIVNYFFSFSPSCQSQQQPSKSFPNSGDRKGTLYSCQHLVHYWCQTFRLWQLHLHGQKFSWDCKRDSFSSRFGFLKTLVKWFPNPTDLWTLLKFKKSSWGYWLVNLLFKAIYFCLIDKTLSCKFRRKSKIFPFCSNIYKIK